MVTVRKQKITMQNARTMQHSNKTTKQQQQHAAKARDARFGGDLSDEPAARFFLPNRIRTTTVSNYVSLGGYRRQKVRLLCGM